MSQIGYKQTNITGAAKVHSWRLADEFRLGKVCLQMAWSWRFPRATECRASPSACL